MINMNIAVKLFQSIGAGIGIGLAYSIILFAILFIIRISPWLLMKIVPPKLFKSFDKVRDNKQVQISYCHPSQVIKNLKAYGIQSIFADFSFPSSPAGKPNKFRNDALVLGSSKMSYKKCFILGLLLALLLIIFTAGAMYWLGYIDYTNTIGSGVPWYVD